MASILPYQEYALLSNVLSRYQLSSPFRTSMTSIEMTTKNLPLKHDNPSQVSINRMAVKNRLLLLWKLWAEQKVEEEEHAEAVKRLCSCFGNCNLNCVFACFKYVSLNNKVSILL